MTQKQDTLDHRLLRVGLDYTVTFCTVKQIFQITDNVAITETLCGLTSLGVTVYQVEAMAIAYRKGLGTLADVFGPCDSCKGCFALSLCEHRKLDW